MSPTPAPADPTQALIDAPGPTPWVHSVPMFPMGGTPFTPTSECPHWCRRCSGSGVDPTAGFDEDGRPAECPDCLDEHGRGTGRSHPAPPFVCMVCHRSGMDGSPELPDDVEPLPLDPPPAEDADAAEAA